MIEATMTLDAPRVSQVSAEELQRRQLAFVRFFDNALNSTDKTQRQVALEMGYPKPNIVTMFKQGTTRIPLDRLKAFALSVDIDPIDIMRRWLFAYEPALLEALENTFGMAAMVTRREIEWAQMLRRNFPDGIPPADEMAEQALSLLKS